MKKFINIVEFLLIKSRVYVRSFVKFANVTTFVELHYFVKNARKLLECFNCDFNKHKLTQIDRHAKHITPNDLSILKNNKKQTHFLRIFLLVIECQSWTMSRSSLVIIQKSGKKVEVEHHVTKYYVTSTFFSSLSFSSVLRHQFDSHNHIVDFVLVHGYVICLKNQMALTLHCLPCYI